MGFTRSIRTKIVCFIALAAITILAIGLALGYYSGYKILLRLIGDNLQTIAQAVSQEVGNKVDREMAYLTGIAANADILKAVSDSNLLGSKMTPEEFQRYISDMDSRWAASTSDSSPVKSYLDNEAGKFLKTASTISLNIEKILITDKYGALVAASGKTTDFYQADEEWWKKAYGGGRGKSLIADLGFDQSIKTLATSFVLPIIGEKGDVIGILKASVGIDKYLSFIAGISIGRSGKAALIDGDGLIILKKDVAPLSQYMLTKDDIDKVRMGLVKNMITAGTGDDDPEKFWAFSPVNSPLLKSSGLAWEMVVSQNSKEAFGPIRNLLFQGLALICVLVLLLVPVSSLFGRAFTEPIENLNKAVQRVSKGEYNFEFSAAQPDDEIGDLQGAFMKMSLEVKNRETSLSRAKSFTESIISSIVDAFVAIDRDNNIIMVNPAIINMLGYTEKEMIGMSISMLFPKDESPGGLFENISLGEANRSFGSSLLTKRGKRIPVNIRCSGLIEDETTTGVVFIARDMSDMMLVINNLVAKEKELNGYNESLIRTQRSMLNMMGDLKQAKEDLEKAYAKLKVAQSELIQSEKESALGRFSVGIAHEVKNPLAVILGSSEYLASKLSGSDDDIISNVDRIKNSVLRANTILEDLLRYVRPSGLNMERASLNSLVVEIGPLFKIQPYFIRSEIALDLSPEEIWVQVDRNQIHQVIFNLVKNAIEASPAGNKVVVKTEISDGAGVISVIDKGHGMSKETISSMFEPFFTTKRPGKGTGLGMVIAKAIVDNHRGKLLIESELGKGTTIKVALPLYVG